MSDVASDNNEDIFQPLRKKFKRKSTGKEDNFMQSYYNENKHVSEMTDEEIEQMRWLHGIEVIGEHCPRPIMKFEDLDLPLKVFGYLKSMGCFSPTAIQMQALSCVMSGRDVIGLAETGSGKTLAYTLPLCMYLNHRKPTTSGHGPVGLILLPTRELMQQVSENVVKILECLDSERNVATSFNMMQDASFRSPMHDQNAPNAMQFASNDLHAISGTVAANTHAKAVYSALGICGGVPIHEQIVKLKEGVDVVIATPGRLLDLCDRGILKLDQIAYLVMDEADRMLGMGLEEQLRKIVSLATKTLIPRQTLLWSATMPTSLERLARSAVLNPITIQVGESNMIPQNVEQDVIFTYHCNKPQKLFEILRSTPYPPVIIFASSIQNVDLVVDLLHEEQFHVAGLHSKKLQDYRFSVVKAFKNERLDILVATDVASRGLDIPEVSTVINYDLPDTIEDYIHRCGRTGRLGTNGTAVSFLTLDCKIVEELRNLLEASRQNVPREMEDLKQFGSHIIKTEFGDKVIHH